MRLDKCFKTLYSRLEYISLEPKQWIKLFFSRTRLLVYFIKENNEIKLHNLSGQVGGKPSDRWIGEWGDKMLPPVLKI